MVRCVKTALHNWAGVQASLEVSGQRKRVIVRISNGIKSASTPSLRGYWVLTFTVTRHGKMCSAYCQRSAELSIAQTIAFYDSHSEETLTARFNSQDTCRCPVFVNCVVNWRGGGGAGCLDCNIRCHTVLTLLSISTSISIPHPPCSNLCITPFASERIGFYIFSSAAFRKMKTC